jgi:HTH-type transcriptional regulator / antitoxin HigA
MSITKSRKPSESGDIYLDLVREVPLRPIRSEAELDRAIAMIDRLTDREELRPEESDYRDVLSGLVHSYEEEHDPIPDTSPDEMLRFLIDSKGVTQAAVAIEAGISESTISEILSGKRGISRSVRERLGKYFAVRPSAFA